MMLREMMKEYLDSLVDVSYEMDEDGFDVVIEDFNGFDEGWNEVMREYENPEAVAQFEQMLQNECLSAEGDYYRIYHFDGFDVQLGYASFDI